jgi:hypothetical protein
MDKPYVLAEVFIKCLDYLKGLSQSNNYELIEKNNFVDYLKERIIRSVGKGPNYIE